MSRWRMPLLEIRHWYDAPPSHGEMQSLALERSASWSYSAVQNVRFHSGHVEGRLDCFLLLWEVCNWSESRFSSMPGHQGVRVQVIGIRPTSGRSGILQHRTKLMSEMTGNLLNSNTPERDKDEAPWPSTNSLLRLTNSTFRQSAHEYSQPLDRRVEGTALGHEHDAI